MKSKHTSGLLEIKAALRPNFYEQGDHAIHQMIDGKHCIIGEAYGQWEEGGLPGEANARLWAAAPVMEQALRAVLLFHSSSPWDAEKQRPWEEFTGTTEATTKILCDTIRVILFEATGKESSDG